MSNPNIVGNVDQIIQLASGAYYRIANSTAIDRTIGADVNIAACDNGTCLRNFIMFSTLFFNISETITANDGTAENGIVITNRAVMINVNIIMQITALTNLCTITNNGIGTYNCMTANRCISFNN